MSAVHLILEQGSGVGTMIAVLAVGVVLAAAFYRRAFGRLPAERWRVLFGLRTVAIVLVVLLLFRPVLSLEEQVLRRRSLVVLVDISASMATADDPSGMSRFDQARVRVLDWAGKLAHDFDVHLFAFADRAQPLQHAGELGRLRPDGQATSLSRALLAAASAVPARDDPVVLLLSDGVHNAAGDPLTVAAKLGRVVHTIGVGNSLRDGPAFRDVRVADLECPEQLPVNNRAKLVAHLGQTGLAGDVVTVALEEGGTPIAQSEVELKGGNGLQDVPFEFVPTVRGRHTYTVRVPPAQGEKIAENNHREAVTQVVDARIRVLYLEGTLRAEYGAIVQRFLSKDPDLEFCALVQTRPGVFLQRTNIEGLKLGAIPSDPAVLGNFDVVVLGDLDSSYWQPGAMAALVNRVRAGAGLLVLGGYHSLGPGGYGGSPLEDALPIFAGPREIGQATEAFLPRLTPEGHMHPLFTNISKFFATAAGPPQASGLPPLDGCVRVVEAKPGATVLAVHPTERARGAAMPVLAVQPFEKGRTAVFTGDTTRNWQQAPKALDQESPFLRFWGQTIRWLADRTEALKPEAGVEAQTEKVYYEPDAPVTIRAVVRDQKGEGTDKAEVLAQVQGPTGASETVELNTDPAVTGRYSGMFEPKASGSYKVFVTARVGGADLHAETAAFDVGRPNLEFDRLDLDDALLKKLATTTKGHYRHLSTADSLIAELDRSARRSRVSFEQPLYWPGPYWGIFVAVLTAEWVLRKRYQLR
jgi:uncharacterized membrane protein